jgi:hypothetical protein
MKEAMLVSTTDLSSALWRKSSRSGNGTNDNCVEVAFASPAVAVRDSKNPGGGALVLPASSWTGFLATLGGLRWSPTVVS